MKLHNLLTVIGKETPFRLISDKGYGDEHTLEEIKENNLVIHEHLEVNEIWFSRVFNCLMIEVKRCDK